MKKPIILFTMLLLAGCAGMRQQTVALSAQYIENRQAAWEIAKNLTATWEMRSGFIQGSLAGDFYKLPIQIQQAFCLLDHYAKQNFEDLNDQEVGRILGLRLRLLGDMSREVFRILNIDIVKIFKMII